MSIDIAIIQSRGSISSFGLATQRTAAREEKMAEAERESSDALGRRRNACSDFVYMRTCMSMCSY